MDLRFHPRTEAQKELRFVPRPRGCGWPGYTSIPVGADDYWGLPRRHPQRARGKMLAFSQFYGWHGGGLVSVGCQVLHAAAPSPTGRIPLDGPAFIDSWHAIPSPTSSIAQPPSKQDVRALQAATKRLWDQYRPQPEPIELPPPRIEWDEGPGHILD